MNIGVNSMAKTYKSWANGYKALADVAFKKGKDYREGIFYMDTTENWQDRIGELGGVEDFAVWEDGERAAQTGIDEVYFQTFTQVPYGREVPIGRILGKFQGRDVRLVTRASKQLGARAYRLMQRAPFSLLAYAFSTTNSYLTGVTGSSYSMVGPDGKKLASTLHPCSPTNPTTWSNVLSGNNAVGEEALKLMIENLHNQLDDRGEKKFYGEGGYIWVVPLEKYPDAVRICGGKGVDPFERPETTDREKNVYNGAFDGRPIEVRWVPFMDFSGLSTSSTAHVLVAREAVEEEMPISVLTSQDYYTDDYTDESTKTVYVRGQMMFSVGFLSGRSMCFSQGTGSGAYTD